MAKSVGVVYAILLLFVVSTTMPRASSLQLLPDILKCWKAITEVENCVVKLIPSFLSLNIKLSQECCKAITDIEDGCLPFVFTFPVIGAQLSNITSTVCGILADPSHPPMAA